MCCFLSVDTFVLMMNLVLSCGVTVVHRVNVCSRYVTAGGRVAFSHETTVTFNCYISLKTACVLTDSVPSYCVMCFSWLVGLLTFLESGFCMMYNNQKKL